MTNEIEQNAALPADVPAAEACADAAPKGAKKYVKPAMKVFKLDCQMLAASRPPVVTLRLPSIDYYYWCCGNHGSKDSEVYYCCGDTPAALSEKTMNKALSDFRDYGQNYPSFASCVPESVPLAKLGNLNIGVSIANADWDPETFWQNAQISCDGNNTYMGVPYELNYDVQTVSLSYSCLQK